MCACGFYSFTVLSLKRCTRNCLDVLLSVFAGQRLWYCAVRPGALKDQGFMDFLQRNFDVFADMDSLSLWDKFKDIIPLADGWVGCKYRLSYPRTDWYYTRVKYPAVDDFGHMPVYSSISTVKGRKAPRRRWRRRSSSNPARRRHGRGRG